MASKPRVRFAPSPTGYLHVGSARAALYNWLFARQCGGTFVLRVEDTDTARNRPEWSEGIVSALSWLGLDWDEGPYYQSERSDLYAAAADDLAGRGVAYFCDCTREEIEARAKARGGAPGYDGHCRDRGLGPGAGRALRFRTPDEGETVVEDVVRGTVVFENAGIEDFVLVRSNGAPLFLFANVVDDSDMAITHVVRGEDHLPNTPKYVLLWRALGAGELPLFAHLPLLVNDKRQKLSKRRDPVAVESYRDQGYLADALVNFLVLLGWGPRGESEILGRDELVEQFRLEDVSHSPAFFDVVKLRHFNGVYIRAMSTADFVQAVRPWLPASWDIAVFERLAPLVQERIETLAEAPQMVDFAFREEPVVDQAAWTKAVAGDEMARPILEGALEAYSACEWSAAALHGATLSIAESCGRRLGKAQAPIRVAITGRTVGPPLFESLEVLGREQTIARLRAALASLPPAPSPASPSGAQPASPSGAPVSPSRA